MRVLAAKFLRPSDATFCNQHFCVLLLEILDPPLVSGHAVCVQPPLLSSLQIISHGMDLNVTLLAYLVVFLASVEVVNVYKPPRSAALLLLFT